MRGSVIARSRPRLRLRSPRRFGGFRRDLNVVMSRGVWRIFAVALGQYERTLESHALLDFPGVLARAVKLLQDLDEFAESRLRLEARYRHVLLDEFQDTSRAQWELVRQLVRTWGEGLGASDDAIQPSIFIVGDRKQSIYGFRDADVALVDDAAAFIEELRPGATPRQAITVSFRSAPAILAFVNDVFAAIASGTEARRDAFRYDERDRFPPVDVDSTERAGSGRRLAPDARDCRRRDRAGDSRHESQTKSSACSLDRSCVTARPASGDRRHPRTSPFCFVPATAIASSSPPSRTRGVSSYVYKGLGFFESDEVQDAVALLRYPRRSAVESARVRVSALARGPTVRWRRREPRPPRRGRDPRRLDGGQPTGRASFGDEDRACSISCDRRCRDGLRASIAIRRQNCWT